MRNEGLVLVVIVVIITIILIYRFRKSQTRKKRDFLLRELKNTLFEDNQLTKELYHSNAFLQENFRDVFLLKRLVLYGFVDNELFIIKYKLKELRIGFPSTFRTDDKLLDICIDLSEFKENNNLPNTLGAENHCWYVKVGSMEDSIERHIIELSSVRNNHSNKIDRNSSYAINNFHEYEEAVKKLGHEYL